MTKYKRSKFWVVWSPQGRSPTYEHLSRKGADEEANRLAAANPTKMFFVLKAVNGVTTEKPATRTIKLRKRHSDGIPF